MTTQLKKLTPNIMVENVKHTLEYYRDVLGFQLITTVPPEGDSFDWAMMQRDNVEIMFQSRDSISSEVSLFKDMPIGGGLSFFIEVADIHNLYSTIKEKATILQNMHTTFYDMQEFTIQDCNGFILTFAEPV